MGTANIRDRGSIERLYPPDVFAADAAANDRPKAERLQGVRIASAPDDAGEFALERSAQQAGEAPGAVFLAPFHRRTAADGAASDPDPRHGYDGFIDDIIAAAQRRGYHPSASPGPGDARLRGLRQ